MRRDKEARTVACMIGVYCHGNHGTRGGLCSSCEELLAYANFRLSKCPHGDEKPFCSNCPIHCYKPDMKEKIRAVMRYAGPRMMLHHPIIAVQHVIAVRREKKRKP